MTLRSQDFESCASTNSAIPAYLDAQRASLHVQQSNGLQDERQGVNVTVPVAPDSSGSVPPPIMLLIKLCTSDSNVTNGVGS